jgi:hypothetical protein
MIRFFALLFALTAIRCAGVPPNSVQVSSKWDQSNNRQVKSITINTDSYSEKDETMSQDIVKGFKESLQQKGLTARVDLAEVTTDTTYLDALLVLGKSYEYVSQGPGIPIGGRVIQTSTPHRRLVIHLVNPVNQRDIWLGEVSFVPYDAKYVGHKVVQQWTAAGLLSIDMVK